MKRCLYLLALGIFLSSAAHAADKKVTRESLQKLYSDFLKEEGYKPEVDEDGDVRFKHEGMTYFIQVDDSDPQFFRLILANIWEIESEDEMRNVFAAADHSNAQSKVSKVFTVKNNVWVSIELFVEKPEEFRGVFRRCLSALQNGTQNFVVKMKEGSKGVSAEELKLTPAH